MTKSILFAFAFAFIAMASFGSSTANACATCGCAGAHGHAHPHTDAAKPCCGKCGGASKKPCEKTLGKKKPCEKTLGKAKKPCCGKCGGKAKPCTKSVKSEQSFINTNKTSASTTTMAQELPNPEKGSLLIIKNKAGTGGTGSYNE